LLLCGSEGSFQETAPRKTAENTLKCRDGSVGSPVANHRDGSESSMVGTTLLMFMGTGKVVLVGFSLPKSHPHKF